MSCLFSGRGTLNKSTLQSFHALAARTASPLPPFCTAEDLEEMRLAVLREDRQLQDAADIEAAKRLVESAAGGEARSTQLQHRHRVKLRKRIRAGGRRPRVLRREALAAAVLAMGPAVGRPPAGTEMAPVPQPEGDRRHAEHVAVEWPGLSDLMARLETGRAEDVAGLMRHTGLAADPDQAAAALAACEASGLEDVVTGLVEQTLLRPDGDLLQILKNLHHLGRHHLVGQLLESAKETAPASAV
jgi:hypothetical protein